MSSRKTKRAETGTPDGTPKARKASATESSTNNVNGTDKVAKFDPVALGLPADFVLTDYTRLKGCSCKVPQPKLLELLRHVAAGQATPTAQLVGDCDEGACSRHKGNVGMDCSILPLNRKDEHGKELFIVSTTDFFFPSVEDPYLQGQIGAANVLSDMYSMGITKCDTMLMLLAASTDMDAEQERYVVTGEIMKGYVERTALGGAKVTGGQTVLNPWPLIGGVAMSVVSEDEMITPKIGLNDVVVLTKPIGNQLAVNLKQWTKRPSPLYKKCIEGQMSLEEIDELYYQAAANMARLNLTGAQLMQKYKARGSTDVTGFGILGHAINYAEAHEASRTSDKEPSLQIILDVIPTLKGAIKASRLIDDKYKLFQGLSAETSGGLLVSLPSEAAAKAYMKDLKTAAYGGYDSWIVGRVVERPKGAPYAVLSPSVQFLEV